MKKFQFRLNKVMEVREIEKEQAENQLLKANRKARKIEKMIISMENRQSQIYDFVRKEDLSLHELQMARDFIKVNRYKITKSEKKLLKQQQEVAHCQKQYIEKRQSTEVLKKLKEKEFKSYYKNLLLKEQKELDEIGLRTEGLQEV